MWSGICCVWQNVSGIPFCFLPWELAKMRARAAEKMGIPPSSFAQNLSVSCAPGLVVNQVHREMLIRGVHPKAKPSGPVITVNGAPSVGEEMER